VWRQAAGLALAVAASALGGGGVRHGDSLDRVHLPRQALPLRQVNRLRVIIHAPDEWRLDNCCCKAWLMSGCGGGPRQAVKS